MKKINSYIFSSNSIIFVLRRLYIEFRIFIRYITIRKLFNLLYNTFEIKAGKTNLNSMPPWVHIETTNRCNLKCPYCVGTGRPYNEKGTMTFEAFQKVVDKLAPTLVFARLYNQGDPFVDPLLPDRLSYLRKLKVPVILSTNFSMPLSDDYLKKLVSLKPDHIVVCFESLDNEIYRRYRIGGDIEIVKSNLARLVAEKKRSRSVYPFVSIRVFQTQYNINEKKDILEFYRKSGADNILFLHMYVDMNNKKAVSEWLPQDSPLLNNDVKISCPELFNHPVINFRGEVLPCCAISDYRNNFGSLENTDFRSIWNSPAYIAARKVFTEKLKSEGLPPVRNICRSCRGIIKKSAVSDHELFKKTTY